MVVFENWVQFAAAYFAITVTLYVVFSGLSYWLFWVHGRRSLDHFKIQPHWPRPGQVRSEVAWSMLSMAVFTVVATLLYVAWQLELTPLLYTDIGEYGWGYFWLSVVLMVLIHDAWFYWTHRFMHLPWIFRHIHARHHRSRTPTPWSTHAFHPLEAVVEISILPVIVFTMPAHPAAILVFIVILKAYNTVGHMGYELFPRAFARHRLFEWSNSTTHHDMHHSHVGGHFGLYFNVWDRLMGTNLPDYRATFERVSSQRPARSETVGTAEG